MKTPDTKATGQATALRHLHGAGRHVRSNVVAYLALAVAVGSGGSYALAAIGEQRHHRRLRRQGQRRHAPRQAPALRASSEPHRAQLGARPGTRERLGGGRVDGHIVSGAGVSITHAGVGVYNVTVTAASCRDAGNNAPVVSVSDSEPPCRPATTVFPWRGRGPASTGIRGVHDPHRRRGERGVPAEGRVVQLHRLVR